MKIAENMPGLGDPLELTIDAFCFAADCIPDGKRWAALRDARMSDRVLNFLES